MYESGAQKSCIQKTNAIFSIYKMSEQQKLGKIQKAFQKSPDFVPPEQRSKKYVFIDFLFNLVTKFLCFLNFSQFLLLWPFDIKNFNDDIEQIKINQTCHEVDSVYNEYETDFINVLNKHAPIKIIGN
jgi:hypothetical protein